VLEGHRPHTSSQGVKLFHSMNFFSTYRILPKAIEMVIGDRLIGSVIGDRFLKKLVIGSVDRIGFFFVIGTSLFMFESGLSASTLKFIRSSLSFFLCESHKEILECSLVSRLLKSFEKTRPTVPRYAVTWDVNKVLSFLQTWFPHRGLSLKQLTLKTCMLIALSGSDRAQTIQSIRVDRCVCTARGVEFPIFSRLKTSRPLRKPCVVICPRWSVLALDVEKMCPRLHVTYSASPCDSCLSGKTQAQPVVPLS